MSRQKKSERAGRFARSALSACVLPDILKLLWLRL